MRIYCGESDQWDGKPLYEALVHGIVVLSDVEVIKYSHRPTELLP